MRYRKMLIEATSPQFSRDYWLHFVGTKKIYTTLEEGLNTYGSTIIRKIAEDVLRYKKSMEK